MLPKYSRFQGKIANFRFWGPDRKRKSTPCHSSGRTLYTPIVSCKSVHVSRRRSKYKIFYFLEFFREISRKKFFSEFNLASLSGTFSTHKRFFLILVPVKSQFWTIVLLGILFLWFIYYSHDWLKVSSLSLGLFSSWTGLEMKILGFSVRTSHH